MANMGAGTPISMEVAFQESCIFMPARSGAASHGGEFAVRATLPDHFDQTMNFFGFDVNDRDADLFLDLPKRPHGFESNRPLRSQ